MKPTCSILGFYALEYGIGVVKYLFIVAGKVGGVLEKMGMAQLMLKDCSVGCVEYIPVDVFVDEDVNIIKVIYWAT